MRCASFKIDKHEDRIIGYLKLQLQANEPTRVAFMKFALKETYDAENEFWATNWAGWRHLDVQKIIFMHIEYFFFTYKIRPRWDVGYMQLHD